MRKARVGAVRKPASKPLWLSPEKLRLEKSDHGGERLER
jgi:hypothetical protein